MQKFDVIIYMRNGSVFAYHNVVIDEVTTKTVRDYQN